MATRNEQLTRPLIQKIKEVVQRIATQEGINLVFDASDGNRSLLLPLQALDARRQMIGSHEVILQGTHGYSIAVFRDHGLGYAITGDIEEPELLRLISAAVARP